MILVPAFPPPNTNDPDDIGWPLCTAAAYWRQGRYDESLAEIRLAAEAAEQLKLADRHAELVQSMVALQTLIDRHARGDREADPRSVVVSEDYPSIEVLEGYIALEELSMQAHAQELPNKPVASTLPSGLFGEGARPVKRIRYTPKRVESAPLVLDFEGSILQRAPSDPTEDEAPLTKQSDPPRKR